MIILRAFLALGWLFHNRFAGNVLYGVAGSPDASWTWARRAKLHLRVVSYSYLASAAEATYGMDCGRKSLNTC